MGTMSHVCFLSTSWCHGKQKPPGSRRCSSGFSLQFAKHDCSVRVCLTQRLHALRLVSLLSVESVLRETLAQPQVTDLALHLRTLPPASLGPRRIMQSGGFIVLFLSSERVGEGWLKGVQETGEFLDAKVILSGPLALPLYLPRIRL